MNAALKKRNEFNKQLQALKEENEQLTSLLAALPSPTLAADEKQ
jgi:hypothetical protein